jgi:RNA polymerase sigma-70 factor (ECF subfamily)
MQDVDREDREERNAGERQIQRNLEMGDPAAIHRLWEGHAEELHAFLLAMLRSRHDAEDALQEVFVQVARKRTRVARARNVRAYLYRMARNAAVSLMRKRTRRTTAALALEDRWLAPVDGPGPDRGRGEALIEALARLPDAQRVVIVMKVYREMTFAEIAESLGISTNTAASRYRYGVEKLRNSMRSAEG